MRGGGSARVVLGEKLEREHKPNVNWRISANTKGELRV